MANNPKSVQNVYSSSRVKTSEFSSTIVLFQCFWRKMLFKFLSELTVCELRKVLRRVGKIGIIQESSAIVQLTVFLVRNSQDPFSYCFPISVDKPESGRDLAISFSGFANGGLSDSEILQLQYLQCFLFLYCKNHLQSNFPWVFPGKLLHFDV